MTGATTTWATVLLAGVGCYLLRISLVAFLGRREPSATTIRLAGLVMPAAFASLAAAALFRTTEQGATDATAPLLGAAVAAGVAVRTSNSNAALLAGLATAAAATALTSI